MDHQVRTDPQLVFLSHAGLYHPRSDVQDWLKKTLGHRGIYSSKWGWRGRWSVSSRSTYGLFSFARKQDAVMFKLRWGGTL